MTRQLTHRALANAAAGGRKWPLNISAVSRTINLPATDKAWLGSTDSGSNTATPIGGASPGSTNMNVMESSVLNGARTLDIVHVYRNWGDVTGTFPGNTSAGVNIDTHVAAGKMVYIDWSPDTALHTPIAGGWPAITAGTYDTAIQAFASKIKTWQTSNPGKKLFFGFGHESDLEIQRGSVGYSSVGTPATYADTQTAASEYRAAYRHIYSVFNALGVAADLVWVWSTEGHLDDVHLWDAMYPGDDVVDWLAYDPYGKVEPTSGASTSRTWRASFGKQTGADSQGTYRFYQWATGLGATTNGLAIANGTQTLSKSGDLTKPIMASEFASAYDPTINSANLATWRTFWSGGISDFGANAYPNIRAVIFFGSASSGQYDPRNDVGAGSIASPEAGSVLANFRSFAALARLNATRPY